MVILVYGCPCSGKSTFIEEHAKDGDLICDVDLIYQAISTRDAHDADLYIHEIALQLRDMLLDTIRDRRGNWQDAYVVSIANTEEKLQKDKERIHADECIYIDTPYETCLKRAENRPLYFKLLIQEWHETNTIN